MCLARKADKIPMTTLDEIRNSEKKAATKIIKGSRNPIKIKHALVAFYQSLDSNLNKLTEYAKAQIACKSGCAYCCHLKVDSRAHEIFLIADYVRKQFSPDELLALKRQLRESSEIIAPLTYEQHLTTNVKCGLLQDNRCSVYAARPALCRAYHSISLDKCIETFDSPENMQISSENQTIHWVSRSAIQGFEEALKKVKLDNGAYEINKALLYALDDPECERRWQQGKKAFPDDAIARTASQNK